MADWKAIGEYSKWKKHKNVFSQYNTLRQESGVNYANALAMGQKALKATQAGYTNALNATNTQAGVAKQAILNREKENLGALKTDLVDTGMSGGTLGANLQRAVYSDTNTAMSGVDAAIAQIRSNLMAQQGEAMAGQYGGLAALFQGRDAANMGLGSSYLQWLASQPKKQKHSGLNAVLGFGGQLASSYLIGGGFGGGQ